MENPEEGFYWIKMKNMPSEWIPAEYAGFDMWFPIGYRDDIDIDDILEIGPKLNPPQ